MARLEQNVPCRAGRMARADHDVQILIERGQKFHETFDSELIESVVFER